MNKNLLIASAATAGAAVLLYLFRNKINTGKVKQIVAEQSRHLTNAFSKAKHVNMEG